MSCSSNGQTDLDSGNPSPGHGIPLPSSLNRPPSAKSLKKPASKSSKQSPTPTPPNGRWHAATSPTGKSNTTLRFSLSGATVSHQVSPPIQNTFSGFRYRHASTSSWNRLNISTGNGCHGKKPPRNASLGQIKKLSNCCRDTSSKNNAKISDFSDTVLTAYVKSALLFWASALYLTYHNHIKPTCFSTHLS